MKTNAIVRIVLLSLAIVLLMGILLAGIGLRTFSVLGHWDTVSTWDALPGGTVASSGEVSAASVRHLCIDWVGGSIQIQPGDTDKITFSESGTFSENDRMVYKLSGDTLTIHFRSSGKIINWGWNAADINKDLLVTVPHDWVCEEVSIDSVSAKISAEGLTTDAFEIDNVSGTCVLADCTLGDLEVDTVSGDVEFYGSLRQCDCSSVSANCRLTLASAAQEIDFDAVSGDLHVALPEGVGFSADLDTLSGNIITADSTHSDHCSSGNGACRISASTTSGDVHIQECTHSEAHHSGDTHSHNP